MGVGSLGAPGVGRNSLPRAVDKADDGHETRKRDFSLITDSIRAENGF